MSKGRFVFANQLRALFRQNGEMLETVLTCRREHLSSAQGMARGRYT
jgi:hypothetical protein